MRAPGLWLPAAAAIVLGCGGGGGPAGSDAGLAADASVARDGAIDATTPLADAGPDAAPPIALPLCPGDPYPAGPPIVTLNNVGGAPAELFQVLASERVYLSVTARAADGRALTTVEATVDGSADLRDSQEFPGGVWFFTIDVKSATPPGSEIHLGVHAVDDAGESSDTPVAELVVIHAIDRTALPAARFVGWPQGPLTIHLDAGGSTDDDGPVQVRWDFDGDGSWDTEFVSTLTVVFTYPAPGLYRVRAAVRDTSGQIVVAQVRIPIVADEGLYVCGDVAPGPWSGTVLLACPSRLSAGDPLAVAPGTHVRVLYHDLDQTGVPNAGLTAFAGVVAAGTATLPVRFAPHGPACAPASGAAAWAGLALHGTGNQLDHVEVSGAAVGLRLPGGSDGALRDVAVDGAGDGIQLSSDATYTLDHITVTDCRGDGLAMTEGIGLGSAAITRSTFTGNGHAGVHLAAATTGARVAADLSHCELRDNGIGLLYRGDAGGRLEASIVTGNRHDGIQLRSYLDYASPAGTAASSPLPVVTGNDLHDNAVDGGSALADPAIALHAAKTTAATDWPTPSGGALQQLRFAFTGDPAGVETSGLVQVGAVPLFTPLIWPLPAAGSLDLLGDEGSVLHAEATSATLDFAADLTVDLALYVDPAAHTELTSACWAGAPVIDATGNYWGVADPANVILTAVPGAVDAIPSSPTPIPGAGAGP